MNHPMKRNRRRLRLRAARWALHKRSTYEAALARRLWGYDPYVGADGAQPRGLLNILGARR